MPQTPTKATTAMGAALSMSLCAGLLVASEFLPVSLLSPMARDLAITDGQAGQAISISGLFAVLTSLFAGRFTRTIDRKWLQSAYVACMILSGLIVTLAPTYVALMFGRMLLGVAVGGFWSMTTSLTMRLLSPTEVPKGLAIINAGVAVSSILSAPLGSWLGEVVGWRATFFTLVPLAFGALVWQIRTMPALPPRGTGPRPSPLRLLVRAEVRWAMASVFLLFMGQFAVFTYLRPYLELVVGLKIDLISVAFFGLGLAGLAGTYVVSQILRSFSFAPLIAIPTVMTVVAIGLIVGTASKEWVIALLVLWGAFASAAPVGWGAWLARALDSEAEAGGGLQVAVIQLAIMSGAAAGGMVFDRFGWAFTFSAAIFLLAGSALAAFATMRISRNTANRQRKMAQA